MKKAEDVKAVEKVKEVVAMLPCSQGRVLLQLRDLKPSIVYPGHWGFFSGSIDEGEEPEPAAFRELWEELEFRPMKLIKLGARQVPEVKVLSHVFYCRLEVPIQKLVLHEGMDLGLFTWEEIRTLSLYSPRKKAFFPVVSSSFVLTAIQDVLREADAQGL